jgi:5-formyltetrahydrofolate cyclo-ligase
MNQHFSDKKSLTIIKKKEALRIKMKFKRAQLNDEEIKAKSQAIEKKVLALPVLQQAKTIMCYVSKDTEVATHQLIKNLLSMGKTVAVPFIIKKGLMKAVVIEDFSQLVVGDFNTLQPKIKNFLNKKIDLNLVPALSVSKKGDRLGWGAGFYDRFIINHQPKLNLALLFDCQLVDQLPTNSFDQKMDGVVTENRSIFYHNL